MIRLHPVSPGQTFTGSLFNELMQVREDSPPYGGSS